MPAQETVRPEDAKVCAITDAKPSGSARLQITVIAAS